jgi:hypothetical protein
MTSSSSSADDSSSTLKASSTAAFPTDRNLSDTPTTRNEMHRSINNGKSIIEDDSLPPELTTVTQFKKQRRGLPVQFQGKAPVRSSSKRRGCTVKRNDQWDDEESAQEPVSSLAPKPVVKRSRITQLEKLLKDQQGGAFNAYDGNERKYRPRKVYSTIDSEEPELKKRRGLPQKDIEDATKEARRGRGRSDKIAEDIAQVGPKKGPGLPKRTLPMGDEDGEEEELRELMPKKGRGRSKKDSAGNNGTNGTTTLKQTAATITSSNQSWDVQNFTLSISTPIGSNDRIVEGSFDIILAGDGNAILPAQMGGKAFDLKGQMLTIQFQGNVV